jgi:Plavaka transposase
VLGDLVDNKGKLMHEDLELWMRDPVECVKDLIQNPMFRKNMAYAPERVYRDLEGKTRIYDEMWTADWWWQVQV